MGSEYSSKLSPWLADGSISIKRVYEEVLNYEKKVKANDSTRVFKDELFWRDFNRYWFLHNGNKCFFEYSVYDRTYY